MHLKLLEDTDVNHQKRVYVRLKKHPEIEKFNQLRQLLVNLDKVKPPDNEAFLAQKRQKEQAEHLQNLIREEQEMDKIENLSEESLEDKFNMKATLHIKDAIGQEELSPNKKKVLKIKEIIESDIYK